MFGRYSENVAISGAQARRELVGHWTSEMGTLVSKPIVAELSPCGRLELSLKHASGKQELIWMWTLQPDFVAENPLRVDVCEQSDQIRKRKGGADGRVPSMTKVFSS